MNICNRTVHSSWKVGQKSCPSADGWINKTRVILNRPLFSHREWNTVACIRRNLENTVKERSQSWNNVCHFVSFLGNTQTGTALGTREISHCPLLRQRAVTAVCTGFLAVLERIPKQLVVVVVQLSGDTNHCWTLHVKRAKFLRRKVHINLNVLLRFLKTGVVTAWSLFESFRI